ncbi:MAG: SDR family oxidoreductase [Woeseiaceae bacterium]|nr:SDR family oxidoreductase [Gammaproteobacteria bacterium]NND47046.1 SDR family oxidoreductase [Woeseiaceae bacterium]
MSTVLITGANRGLGLRFSHCYAEQGWTVVAGCRSVSPELAALADKHDNLRIVSLDVTDADSVAALASELGDEPIDVLLNNAGIYGNSAFKDGGIAHQNFGNTDFDNWENVLRVNLFGPMRMAEAFVNNVARSEQKKIVTLSSEVSSNAMNEFGGMYAYRTSKAAVNMLMTSMSVNLAERGILALALHPGWAQTDMGGPNAPITPEESVDGCMRVIADLDKSMVGKLIQYDGQVLPY